ncbi:hypothetical protein [Brevundimonas sp.]|uniref:hypothetical protein n=1 Tax=Brevundimonas sp. TaxID=1871086 RepID=UPI003A8D2B44
MMGRLLLDWFGRTLVVGIGRMLFLNGVRVMIMVMVRRFRRGVPGMGHLVVGPVVDGFDRRITVIVRYGCGWMHVPGGGRGRVLMIGALLIGCVMRFMRLVAIVGLVFVAHVTPVPQPLCTVFDRGTGIT